MAKFGIEFLGLRVNLTCEFQHHTHQAMNPSSQSVSAIPQVSERSFEDNAEREASRTIVNDFIRTVKPPPASVYMDVIHRAQRGIEEIERNFAEKRPVPAR